jgi:threonine synthase
MAEVRFVSTRGRGAALAIREAIERGLAPDGGLFVPAAFPRLESRAFAAPDALPDFGAKILAPFFASDPALAAELPAICRRAFTFPVPLVPIDARPGDFFLELFHGPTAAFKDFAARFLSEIVSFTQTGRRKTVLVATSGDTGGAVAAAFHGRPGIDVAILFPKGRVSPRQEHQLCAWGENVRAFAVDGTFDDCQRVVKEALASPRADEFLSANSISLGRILPQMVYYAKVALARPGAGFVVPTGNLGNALAAVWARECGFPVGPIALALNANRVVQDYLETGLFKPTSARATLANAMDVGVPSNLERLRALYGDSPESFRDPGRSVGAASVTDEEIRAEIRESERAWGRPICPHTAVAAVVRRRLPKGIAGLAREWVLVATAHPAKFEAVVEPLIGHAVQVPEELAKILARPARSESLEPRLAALFERISH